MVSQILVFMLGQHGNVTMCVCLCRVGQGDKKEREENAYYSGEREDLSRGTKIGEKRKGKEKTRSLCKMIFLWILYFQIKCTQSLDSLFIDTITNYHKGNGFKQHMYYFVVM